MSGNDQVVSEGSGWFPVTPDGKPEIHEAFTDPQSDSGGKHSGKK